MLNTVSALAVQSDLAEIVIECRDNLQFMSDLPDGLFKLIVTSPPYNLGKTYEKKRSVHG